MAENEEVESTVAMEDYRSDEDSFNITHSKDVDQSTSDEKKRKQKTTPVQMERMKKFMEDNPIFAGKQLKPDNIKEYYVNLWDNLSAELNALGPPIRTVAEWKKIWSDHKGNKKRKLEAVSVRAPLENVTNRYQTPEDPLYSEPLLEEIVEKDQKESFGSEPLSTLKLILVQQQRHNDNFEQFLEVYRSCHQ